MGPNGVELRILKALSTGGNDYPRRIELQHGVTIIGLNDNQGQGLYKALKEVYESEDKTDMEIENEKLKRENARLRCELEDYKGEERIIVVIADSTEGKEDGK